MQISRIIFHHSASPRTTKASEIREWHLAKGWRDTGYHFVVEASGLIVPARPLHIQGAHCKGHNANSIGICLVGWNGREGWGWTRAQIRSGQRLLDAFRLILGEDIEFGGHRDYKATECPGLDVGEVFK